MDNDNTFQVSEQHRIPDAQVHTLMIRGLAAFWRSIEANAPQTMYHALDEDLFYSLQSVAMKAIRVRLTGFYK